MTFAIAEKLNHLAVHGLFDNRERAERHLALVIPDYVARGYFTDKTLAADSFEEWRQVSRFFTDEELVEVQEIN